MPCTGIYERLLISSCSPRSKELELPRATLARILASRAGHSDFAKFHEDLIHVDANLHYRCKRRKDPDHFYFCHIAKDWPDSQQVRPQKCSPFSLVRQKGARCSMIGSLERNSTLKSVLDWGGRKKKGALSREKNSWGVN